MSPQQIITASVKIWEPAPVFVQMRADHSASVVYPDGSHAIRREISIGEQEPRSLSDLALPIEDLAVLFYGEWKQEQRSRRRSGKSRKVWRSASGLL